MLYISVFVGVFLSNTLTCKQRSILPVLPIVCRIPTETVTVNSSVFPQCPGGTFTPNMKSTKDYPDEVINFMRNHPTMYNSVYPVHKRPLVVRTNVDYEFTTIAVDQVTAADGSYEVLFLGTGTSAPGTSRALFQPYCSHPSILFSWRNARTKECNLPITWYLVSFVRATSALPSPHAERRVVHEELLKQAATKGGI